jgi:hypothetical protein
MKRLFALVFALLVGFAHAQTFTVNNLAVNGTTSLATPLAVSSGGIGTGAAGGAALDNITGFSSTGFLTRTGAGAYAFQSATNGITLGNLVQGAANTVLANATGSTANFTAFAMPSCSTSSSALQYTSGTGFTCGSSFVTTAGATFTGITGVGYAGATFFVNDSTGASQALVQLRNSGTNEWVLYNTSSSNQFSVGRYVSGTFTDNPITVSNSTGLVTLGDGLSASTIVATSTITPSQTAGIVGTTTNNNAQAGSVGEYITATGSAVSLASTTPANCTSVSLTAGDWDVFGAIMFNGAASTSTSVYQTGINTTSATLPAAPFTGEFYIGTSGTNTAVSVAVPTQRENISATTTVYLVAQATFTVSTETVTCVLQARRRR